MLPELSPGLQALRDHSEHVLGQQLPPFANDSIPLHAAMCHTLLGGGKRLRPMLTYATGKALGVPLAQLDAPACAVEIIHAYSLIHDDLPAMDDDALRRGLPTTHIIYGEAIAILAGDALQARAFEVLAGDPTLQVPPATRLLMLRCLGQACGAQGMVGGQVMDLNATGKTLDGAGLEAMHGMKTGALIRTAVRLGGLVANATESELLALDQYARALGLAFQIRDDLLDIEAGTEVLGKTAGKDAAQSKPTFPSVLGLTASRRRLDQLTQTALVALDKLDADTTQLAELARYTVSREH